MNSYFSRMYSRVSRFALGLIAIFDSVAEASKKKTPKNQNNPKKTRRRFADA